MGFQDDWKKSWKTNTLVMAVTAVLGAFVQSIFPIF